jgi:hypothetical protein
MQSRTQQQERHRGGQRSQALARRHSLMGNESTAVLVLN